MLQRPYFWTSLAATAFLVTTEFWERVWGGYHWSMPVLAFLTSGLVEYRQHDSSSKLEADRQKFTIRKFVEPEHKRILTVDPSARVNVMLTTSWWHARRRFSVRWFKRCLVYFEQIGFNDSDGDRSMVIWEEQGVAGMALKYEHPAVGIRENGRTSISVGSADTIVVDLHDIDGNMEQSQRQCVAGLRVIFSYPIRELKREGLVLGAVGKVIGVVNVDSRMSWAAWKKLDPKDFVHVRLAALTNAVAFALA